MHLPLASLISIVLATISQVTAQSSTSSSSTAASSSRASSSTSSGANSTSTSSSSGNATTTTARPTVTVITSFTLSGTQNATVAYTTTISLAQNVSSMLNTTSKTTSTTNYTTLPYATQTVSNGNAGGDSTITAPDPGASGTNLGPGDSYHSAARKILQTSLMGVGAAAIAGMGIAALT